MKPTGRPPSFTQEIADDICEKLSNGISLRTICSKDGMPRRATVMRWLGDERYSAFRDQYARAREAQADTIFDEILDIADDASNDWMERRLKNGEVIEVLNQEHVQRSRLRIDARKWMAGKMQPKKYGDRIELDHGSEGGAVRLIIEGGLPDNEPPPPETPAEEQP